MNDGQELFGGLRIATLCDGVMIVSAGPQSGMAAPVIGDDQRPRRDRAADEAAERFGAAVRGDGHPDPAGIAPVPSVVLRGGGFPVSVLDGNDHQRFVMDSPAFSTRSAANPGFVNLDMLPGLTPDPILIRAHDGGAQLVKQTEGRFIATQSKLALQLDCGHAGRLAGNQPGRPKPDTERGMASLHGRSDHQAGLPTA